MRRDGFMKFSWISGETCAVWSPIFTWQVAAAVDLSELLLKLEDDSELHRDQGSWCTAQITILERHISRLDSRIDQLEDQLDAAEDRGCNLSALS